MHAAVATDRPAYCPHQAPGPPTTSAHAPKGLAERIGGGQGRREAPPEEPSKVVVEGDRACGWRLVLSLHRGGGRGLDAVGLREDDRILAFLGLCEHLAVVALVHCLDKGLREAELLPAGELLKLRLEGRILRLSLVQLDEHVLGRHAAPLQVLAQRIALRAVGQRKDDHRFALDPTPQRGRLEAKLAFEEVVEGAGVGLLHDLLEAALVDAIGEDLWEGENIPGMCRKRLLQRRILVGALVPLHVNLQRYVSGTQEGRELLALRAVAHGDHQEGLRGHQLLQRRPLRRGVISLVPARGGGSGGLAKLEPAVAEAAYVSEKSHRAMARW
mmetsp:Transcript_139948/g.446567  ORF Transcript_139948/g.446567 Transcript_139948/m.446567 type:complete len:329 (+) Transcript_139948:146-1132(+)